MSSSINDVGAQAEHGDVLGIRIAATLGQPLEVGAEFELRREAIAVDRVR